MRSSTTRTATPGTSPSEEKFKEIAEAYGVLMDRSKRSEYDMYGADSGSNGFSRYSQEDIFRDIFNNPAMSDIFRDLENEFRRSGFRSGESFFNDMFFHGQGVFYGKVFFSGPGARASTRSGTGRDPGNIRRKISSRSRPQFRPAVRESGLKKLGKSFLNSLKGLLMPSAGRDLTLGLVISRMDAELGREVMFTYARGDREEPVRLKIPEGIAGGTKLRLQGMGLEDPAGGQPGRFVPGDQHQVKDLPASFAIRTVSWYLHAIKKLTNKIQSGTESRFYKENQAHRLKYKQG